MQEKTAVLSGNVGVSDSVLLRALMDGHPFSGMLLFELPSSIESVREQHSAAPHDSGKPLYPTGFGLLYAWVGLYSGSVARRWNMAEGGINNILRAAVGK